jgi:hypothetical protein
MLSFNVVYGQFMTFKTHTDTIFHRPLYRDCAVDDRVRHSQGAISANIFVVLLVVGFITH